MNEHLVTLDALLARAAEAEDWRRRAECRGADLDLFFPLNESGPATAGEAQAKAYCNRCVVRTECLGWAVNSHQSYGVFGGLTGPERAQKRSDVERPAPVGRLPLPVRDNIPLRDRKSFLAPTSQNGGTSA